VYLFSAKLNNHGSHPESFLAFSKRIDFLKIKLRFIRSSIQQAIDGPPLRQAPDQALRQQGINNSLLMNAERGL
jgi:hypothetical protein